MTLGARNLFLVMVLVGTGATMPWQLLGQPSSVRQAGRGSGMPAKGGRTMSAKVENLLRSAREASDRAVQVTQENQKANNVHMAVDKLREAEKALAALESQAGAGHVSGDGGAIFNAGTLILDAVQVARSSATGRGGGIHNAGKLTLTNGSRVTENSAASGGGLSNDVGATMTLSFVRVDGNHAANRGAGSSISAR